VEVVEGEAPPQDGPVEGEAPVPDVEGLEGVLQEVAGGGEDVPEPGPHHPKDHGPEDHALKGLEVPSPGP